MMSNHTKRCPICFDLFFPSRSDAMYCSAKCRKAASRKQVKAKNDDMAFYAVALEAATTLMGFGAWNQLRTLVITILSQMPDEFRIKVYRSIENDFYRIRDEHRHTWR